VTVLCDKKTTILDKRSGKKITYTNLEWIAHRLVNKAIEGDPKAIEEVIRQFEAREGGAGGGSAVMITITPAGEFKLVGNDNNGKGPGG